MAVGCPRVHASAATFDLDGADRTDGFRGAKHGYQEVVMRRERIARNAPKRPRRSVEILPLDPRDPDIARAKQLHDPVRLRPRPRGRDAA
jgi:hypothetical protein